MVRTIFKLSEKTLVDFSKSPNAWEVVYSALQAPNLTEHHYFHAANILKNKLKIDFVTIRGEQQSDAEKSKSKILQIRGNLLFIIKSFAQAKKPKYICNALCLGMSYVIFHSHQSEPALDLVKMLSSGLQDSVDEVIQLLTILRYLASEVDDESIVIEQSLRESFFDYIDSLSNTVFCEILNYWANRLALHRSGSTDKFFAASSNAKADEFAKNIIIVLNSWRKVELPDDTIMNLPKSNASLMALLFNEMSSKDEDNLETAKECIVGLLRLSMKRNSYKSLNQFLTEQILQLRSKIDEITQ